MILVQLEGECRMPLAFDYTNAARNVELLIAYALDKGLISRDDVVERRNALLDLLQIPEPFDGPVDQECPVCCDDGVFLEGLLERLCDHAVAVGLIEEDTRARRDLFDTRIMGLLTPRESEVVASFERIRSDQGIQAATDWFYKLSGDTNYIRLARIRKDRKWTAATRYGELQLTINLSKPEKDPRDIAAARNRSQSAYPRCVLCVENVGYAGRIDHPARQNHRVIPVTLAGEQWYMQYSPYVYYNEHCIVLKHEHVPMKIERATFQRLLDFLDQFPHYFIGSNADLPIVGGSILSHDHFQGGRHRFPMDDAKVISHYEHSRFTGVSWAMLEWPLSTVRISSADKERLVAAADFILHSWIDYSDESVGIHAYSSDEIRHNTVTPIARRLSNGDYELDVVLRNNRTSPEHPLGIFHPHADLHHIKKENIGLIEVMGLAILPGRLLQEVEQIASILTGRSNLSSALEDESHPLAKHMEWIGELTQRYGTSLGVDEAEKVLQQEIGVKFQRVLEDAGVFKQDAEGIAAFDRFLTSIGASRV